MLKMILAMYLALMDNGQLPDGRLSGSLRSTLSASAGSVATIGTVHFDPRKERWVYTYTIKNEGKLPYLVSWSVADRATGLGSPCYQFELKGGQESVIRVEHEDPPVQVMGVMTCHCRKEPRGMAEFMEKRNVEVAGVRPLFVFGMRGGAPGYVPRGVAEWFKGEK